MATITTTTVATPLIWPSTSLIDRHPKTGHLYAMVKATAANTFQLWRSTNNGGSWSLLMSQVRANVQEISSILIPFDGLVYWAFRTYESGQDRIYTQRIAVGSTLQWGTQVLLSAVTAASAGAVYQGLDIQSATKSSNLRMVVVAVGVTSGSKHGVTLFGETIDSASNPLATNSFLGGYRSWLHTGTGRITPSIEIEHIGDNKNGAPAHLWITWGRTDVYMVKAAWSGSQWVGPPSAVKLNPQTLTPAQDYMTGRWDGQRFLVGVPDPTNTDQVRIFERNRANSATVQRITPDHPAGVVRTCSLAYDKTKGDLRVYAVGTSNADLYYVDFIRATSSWTSWALFSATDIIGTPPNNYSLRRSTHGNARYDVLTAGGVSPFTITHTGQVITYAPDVPVWNTAAIGYNNGQAADVAAVLPLAWTFSDPDPNDVQTAWALQRQVGVGALQYWRASDSTWQAAEVKNLGASSSVNLAAAWALATDLPYTFKIKVWDGSDTASLYSSGLTLVPSAKVDPAITSPVPAGVITADTVTVQWTAAEQTAYRITLATNPGGLVVHDSGWQVGTATSYTVPERLADGSGWTATARTLNNEALASNAATVNFTVDYLEPPLPTLVATPLPADGVISVAITNPTPGGGQPALADQDLYRREVGDTGDGVRVAVGILEGGTHADWRAASGVAYEYRVLAWGVNGTSVFGAWTA